MTHDKTAPRGVFDKAFDEAMKDLARELGNPATASCLPETKDSAKFAELLKQLDQ